MAHPRKYIKPFIHSLVRFMPSTWLQHLRSDKLILPFYHAVSDKSLPHIDHLYPVKSTKEFRADIDFLLTHYKPISVLDLLEHARNKTKITEPSFLLSFDDGLSQVYDVIAPILKEKNVPAVCFLNSAFIDNQDLFYRYKISLIIEHTSNHPSKIPLLGSYDCAENFAREMQTLTYSDICQIDKIAQNIGLDFSQYLAKAKPYLDNEQIVSLIHQGWFFGGHSVDHPHYYPLSLEQQLSQTQQSVEIVNRRFDLDYSLFSFPFTDFGVKQAYFKTLIADKTIDLTFGCAGMKLSEYPFHFQRIPMEDGILSAKDILKQEYLYYGVKAIFDKNKTKRDA